MLTNPEQARIGTGRTAVSNIDFLLDLTLDLTPQHPFDLYIVGWAS